MYIRTKDGRIAEVKENMVIKRCSENVLRLVYKDNRSICVLNGNDDILNQSENLEELCDEFVFKENTRLPHIFVPRGHWNYEECKEWCSNEYSSKNDYELYGAIYTDKGLIYVVKMNENGDLVLI